MENKINGMNIAELSQISRHSDQDTELEGCHISRKKNKKTVVELEDYGNSQKVG